MPLKDLLNAVTVGAKGEELYSTLASRLSRLDKQLTEKEHKKLLEKTDGVTLNQIVKNLLNAYDPDKIEKQARTDFGIEDNDEPTSEQIKEVEEKLIDAAASVFNGELNEFIENVRKAHEQVIDSINIDKVEFAGWDKQAKDKSIELVESFKAYIKENKDEITALQIFYNQPYRRRELTFSMVKELLEKIKEDKPNLAPLRVWQAYEALEKVNGESPKDELVALVSLIRRITNIDEVLTPYDKVVNKNFQDWVFKKQAGALKFTEEQMEWLRMVKDQIATSFHMEVDDFDYEPFGDKGGLGKMWQLFGEKMNEIVDELNEGLVS